jgi:O-antigen/teichoic acid export membrane protein
MAIPIGIANFFLIAYTRTDILMLGWMMDEKSVGMYSAAFKLTGSLTIIPLAITTSLLPLLSNAFGSGDAEKVRQMYRAAFSVAVVAGLPVAVGGYLLAEGVIGLVYGAGYEPAVNALQILAPAMFFSFILYVMTTSAVAVGRTVLFTVYAGMLALLNIALNAALIPSYGIVGASWATLIAEGFLMVAGLAVLRPSVGFPAGGAAIRALGAALLAVGVLIWLPGPLLVRLFISAVLYVTLAYRGRGITSEGTAALEELLRSKFRPRPTESE